MDQRRADAIATLLIGRPFDVPNGPAGERPPSGKPPSWPPARPTPDGPSAAGPDQTSGPDDPAPGAIDRDEPNDPDDATPDAADFDESSAADRHSEGEEPRPSGEHGEPDERGADEPQPSGEDRGAAESFGADRTDGPDQPAASGRRGEWAAAEPADDDELSPRDLAPDDPALDHLALDRLTTPTPTPAYGPAHGPPTGALAELIATAATLAGTSNATAELVGYGPVTAATARELAARPEVKISYLEAIEADLVTAARLVGAGHDPPAPMDRAVRARDGTCRFPGCRQPARRCDADHTIRYPVGPTAMANLACLCRRHHRIKHGTLWSVRQLADAVLVWTSPTRHTYVTQPAGPLSRLGDHARPGTDGRCEAA